MPGDVAVQAAGGTPGSHRFGSSAPVDSGSVGDEPHDSGSADQRPDAGPATGLIAAPAIASIEDALLAARTKLAVAETRLAESHDEAQSIIKDAVEQAALISGRADRAAQEQLSEARQQAAELTSSARAAADKIRSEAAQIMADAQAGSRQLRERLTADLGEQLAHHERDLQDRLTAHEAQLASTAAAADGRIAQRQAQAEAAAQTTIQSAQRELENARLDVATARSDAAAEVRALLETSRADAAREVHAAAEQTRWTQQIIVGLLEAADLDAQHTRRSAHREAAAAIRRTHGRLATILARSRERFADRLVVAEREAGAVVQEATATLDRAAVDAMQIREQADADARRIVAEAEDTAAARLDRAERRLLEAEAGARAIREQVADELTKSQREIREVRRTANAEEIQRVQAARTEADEVRATARQLLADAKAEVAALAERRNAIAGELGNLSGVIEALAVSDAARPMPPRRSNGVLRSPAPADPVRAIEPGAGQRDTEHVPAEGEDTNHDNDEPTSLLDEMMRPND
ncbi:MAG: hypothetical protein DLM57_09160 [Pseudonocardiales bacterium]|nr:MAG: hypothetical protein DLM57_09160 [Pseudonocardiales bacterium]